MMPHSTDHCYYTTDDLVKSTHLYTGVIHELGLVRRIPCRAAQAALEQ
jgi:hypothetical protein